MDLKVKNIFILGSCFGRGAFVLAINYCVWFKTQWQSLYCFVKDSKADALKPFITSKIKLDSIVYKNIYKSCNSLYMSNLKYLGINHFKEFAKDYNHINDIEKIQS